MTIAVGSRRSMFVSYARADNDDLSLRAIESSLSSEEADVYIDDLFDHSVGTDRARTVETALRDADVLVVVPSARYLTTPWTRWEFALARTLGHQLLAWQSGHIGPYSFEAGVPQAIEEFPIVRVDTEG